MSEQLFTDETYEKLQKALENYSVTKDLTDHQLGIQLLEKVWTTIPMDDYRSALVEEAIDRLCSRCPRCLSVNTSRFQWVDNRYFQYWTCWDCDYNFTVKI